MMDVCALANSGMSWPFLSSAWVVSLNDKLLFL